MAQEGSEGLTSKHVDAAVSRLKKACPTSRVIERNSAYDQRQPYKFNTDNKGSKTVMPMTDGSNWDLVNISIKEASITARDEQKDKLDVPDLGGEVVVNKQIALVMRDAEGADRIWRLMEVRKPGEFALVSDWVLVKLATQNGKLTETGKWVVAGGTKGFETRRYEGTAVSNARTIVDLGANLEASSLVKFVETKQTVEN